MIAPSMMRTLLTRALAFLVLAQGCFVDETPCRPATWGCQCDTGDRCEASLMCVENTCVDSEGGLPPTDGGRPPTDAGTPPVGRFARHESCDVIAPPSELALPPLYTKYLHCRGIPIVAPDGVRDDALLLADETMAFLLEGLDSTRARMTQENQYFVLRPAGLRIGDLPEAFPPAQADGPYAYNGGLGVGTVFADNLLCEIGTEVVPHGWENHLVFVFAFQMAYSGLHFTLPRFTPDLEAASAAARAAARWPAIDVTIVYDYFAEMTVTWFEVSPRARPGARNMATVDTREELSTYDEAGHAIVSSIFTDRFDIPGCIRRGELTPYEDPAVSCPSTVADADSHDYPVVRIGNLCWMATNLATTRLAGGASIAEPGGDSAWAMATGPARASVPGAALEDGLLYDRAAVESPGLCPDGWRVPTHEDTVVLENFALLVGDRADVPSHLFALDAWGGSFVEEDSLGFAARPSGSRRSDGTFEGLGSQYFMWTSSPHPGTPSQLSGRRLFDNFPEWQIQPFADRSGSSVRCVRP